MVWKRSYDAFSSRVARPAVRAGLTGPFVTPQSGVYPFAPMVIL